MAETSPNSAGHQSSSVVTLTLTPAFKLVFVSALCITLLSVIVCCPLAVLGASTMEAKALFEACLTTFKLGFGAIIGLLGGKAL